MNRLRDDEGDSPVAERGVELLRAHAATPPDAEMKRRVWSAIQQTRLRVPAPKPFRRLRLAAAFAVVLGLAGTAGAVISQRWIFSKRLAMVEPAGERAETSARPRARKLATRTAGAEVGGTTAAAAAVPARRAAVAAGRAAGSLGTVAARVPVALPRVAAATSERGGARPAVGATPPEAAATARERTQVLDALVAWRRDHDGARAGTLLDEYLARYPRGVLREEALVLAIEAADARGDAATARRLARSYQAAHPNGRFSAFARNRAAAEPP